MKRSHVLVPRLALAALVLPIPVGVLAGCAAPDDAEASDVRWSSREDWARAEPVGFRRLDVAEPDDRRDPAAARMAAIEILEQAARSSNPLLRANAIEALEPEPAALGPAVRAGLGDPNRGVRFAALMMMGRQRMRAFVPLATPLLDDPSGSVRAGAILALRRCGEPVRLDPLASLVLSNDPEVKGNAVFVLGELGDPSAIGLLREAASHRPPRIAPASARRVELQIAEAMVKLGEESEIEAIRAALFSRAEEAELAAFACQLCGLLQDRAFTSALADKARREGRDQEPHEVRLAAAMAVAMMENGRGPLDVPMAYVGADAFPLRAQAATTLGWFVEPPEGGPVVLPTLTTMLGDRNSLVQVAAAGGVLRVANRGRLASGG